MTRPLRTRLLILLIPGLLLIIAIAGGGMSAAARNQVYRMLDADLVESAWVLALWSLAEPRTGAEADPGNVRRELDDVLRQMRQGRGVAAGEPAQLAYRIHRPGFLGPIASPGMPPVSGNPGFARIESGGHLWHVRTVRSGSPSVVVSIAERDDMRRRIVRDLLVWPLLWWLTLLPLTVAVVLLSVRAGLRPLAGMADALRRRRATDLRPIALAAPAEAAPMKAALNDLLSRLRGVLEQERLFHAAAAHELRTPLAGIRLLAEAALERDEPSEAQSALAGIVGSVSRAERVLKQLLALAEINATAAQGLDMTRTEMAPLLRGVIANLDGLAAQRDIDVRLDVEGEPVAQAAPVSLEILLRNLLENALLYTPTGSHVSVSCRAADATTLRLSIVDDGPGLTPDMQAVLTAPFERGSDHDRRGTGLGLAIASRIAQLHGSALTMGPGLNGTGLEVGLTLQRP